MKYVVSVEDKPFSSCDTSKTKNILKRHYFIITAKNIFFDYCNFEVEIYGMLIKTKIYCSYNKMVVL